MRRKLDEEMRPFRMAGREKTPTTGLLRAVRQSLAISPKALGEALGVHRSEVSRLERAEVEGTVTVWALARATDAMGCKVVYGIVPRNGRTLATLAEERRWREVLKAENGEARTGNREQ